jgi:hypothetical protein
LFDRLGSSRHSRLGGDDGRARAVFKSHLKSCADGIDVSFFRRVKSARFTEAA